MNNDYDMDDDGDDLFGEAAATSAAVPGAAYPMPNDEREALADVMGFIDMEDGPIESSEATRAAAGIVPGLSFMHGQQHASVAGLSLASPAVAPAGSVVELGLVLEVLKAQAGSVLVEVFNCTIPEDGSSYADNGEEIGDMDDAEEAAGAASSAAAGELLGGRGVVDMRRLLERRVALSPTSKETIRLSVPGDLTGCTLESYAVLVTCTYAPPAASTSSSGPRGKAGSAGQPSHRGDKVFFHGGFICGHSDRRDTDETAFETSRLRAVRGGAIDWGFVDRAIDARPRMTTRAINWDPRPQPQTGAVAGA